MEENHGPCDATENLSSAVASETPVFSFWVLNIVCPKHLLTGCPFIRRSLSVVIKTEYLIYANSSTYKVMSHLLLST